MPTLSHLLPAALSEPQKIVAEAAISYANAMRGRDVTMSQVCELVAFLTTQLAITEATLIDERKGRKHDRDRATMLIKSYQRTISETNETLRRFGFTPDDLKK